MTRRILTLGTVAAATLAAAVATPAAAVTDGDFDGNGHPNVGMIVFYAPDGAGDVYRYRCSATLVSETVLLTAAHCTDGTVGDTIVSFDPVIAEEPPSGLPAADPETGYVGDQVDEQGRTWEAGTAHTAPGYSDFTDLKNWNDYGVVVLDEPITDVEPATVAPTGYLDTFKQPALNKTIFTTVGYGTEVRKAESGPQKPTPMSYPIIRRVAQEPGQKLTPQILQVNGNGNDNRGTGGTCFGDSGGPTFKDGYLVAVTSYGYTSNCRYLDGLQRVDIEEAAAFLAEFGVEPATLG
ncbi:trypsin-like serine protease [Demequina rhizosphaerae]|uniref:trypsin-like serine protease n=1 Tax=Demequina rhizosphaerae TaxID=1638985 RepID=UPI0007853DE2|nr:trypsin-like serine protease [Demequina rhizosphaerae]